MRGMILPAPQLPATPELYGVGGLLIAIGSIALTALGSFTLFRTRLYGLKRDIEDEAARRNELALKSAADLAAVEERIEKSISRLERVFLENRKSEDAASVIAANETRNALNAIRRDNEIQNEEVKERLRVMRQQSVAMLNLVGKLARATPGVQASEVDAVIGRFLTLEVEAAA